MVPNIFWVNRRTEEFPGVVSLLLSPQNTTGLLRFQPGQFNMLYALGAGEVAISLSGSTVDSEGYMHTVRALGLATQALERLQEGDQLGVRGPFGQGWPLAQTAGREVLIIAGGLGLAPLRPLVYALLQPEANCAGIQLFYGARNPEEMLYREELHQWSQQFAVATTVDAASQDWHGNIGVVTSLLAGAPIQPEKTIAFVCGPEIMMRFSIQELLKQGVPPSAIYLSLERNMKCAIGHCGHCQWGPNFICKDGPVFCYQEIQPWLYIREL